MDIFDLVSGIQKEAIKEEKLEKEKKRELKERRRREKEMNRGKERDKDADQEKGKDNKEVLRRKEGGFEFHIGITPLHMRVIDLLIENVHEKTNFAETGQKKHDIRCQKKERKKNLNL